MYCIYIIIISFATTVGRLNIGDIMNYNIPNSGVYI